MNSDKKCESCGEILKRSGDFARIKREGEPADNSPANIQYVCLNDVCDEFEKSFVDQT